MIAAVSTQRRMRDAQRAGARRQTLQHISRDASRGCPLCRRSRSVPRRRQAARSRSRQSLPFLCRG